MKLISGEPQQRLVVTDLIKKKVKMVKKEVIERRKVWRLKEDDTRLRFEGRVGELVSADATDLWKCFQKGVLKACAEVFGKKKGRMITGTHGGGTRTRRKL